jgi:hypothetical protein
LDGRLSKPLLMSIFDPHSPGHDGAVLIEADRITKFGAHLPLSKNLAEVGMLGTRHAAALGLSEQADCFVIAVSEERGTITLAENGRLERMESVPQLKARLERFLAERFPHSPRSESDWRRLFQENARIKLLSVGLAGLAWLMLAYRAGTIQRTFAVPMEYRNLPSGWVLEGQKPSEARVTLSGSERAFYLLNPAGLIISLDLSNVREGTNRIAISEEDLKRPSNLAVYRIEPDTLILQAYPVETVSLPVEAQVVGEVPKRFRLLGIRLSPSVVRAQVRQSAVQEIKKVLTEPIHLSEVTQTTLLRAKLILPESLSLIEPSVPEVQVRVEVVPEEA